MDQSSSGVCKPPCGKEIVGNVGDAIALLFQEPRGPADRFDPQAILTRVASTLSKLRHGTWVTLLMNNDPSTSVVVVTDDANQQMADFVDRYIASLHRPGVAPTTGLSQRVIETGRPLVIPNIRFDEFVPMNSPAYREYLGDHQLPIAVETVSLALVPMRARGGVIGTLGLFDWNSESPITSEDVSWIEAVALRVGLAVEQAELHNQAITRLGRLSSLTNVALSIASGQDLRLALKLIAEQLTASLPADAVDVLLLDESQGVLSVAASAGFHSGALPGYRFPAPSDLSDITANRLQFESSEQVEWIGHTKRRSLFAREGFKAYRAIPLTAARRTLGLLEVFNRTPIEPDQEWLAFFELSATCASIAIDHIGLSEAVRRGAPLPRIQTISAPALSPRERQILELVVDGSTNREIADHLHLSPNTIKFHVRQLLDKVRASNRTELATTAAKQGWLKPT